MKGKFSNSWIGSRQIRKQRKYRANAPLHIKLKLMGAHLSKDLRRKYGIRSISIRKGDEVRIMRGKFKGKTGKIGKVNIKKQKVAIDGIQNKKKDGTKIDVYFDTSNLLIRNLNDGDKKRIKKSENSKKESKSGEKENASEKRSGK